MKKCNVLTLLIIFLIFGCASGIKFADVNDMNMPLPQDFKNRSLFKQTDIFKYHLTELAGSVVFCNVCDPNNMDLSKEDRFIMSEHPPVLNVIENSAGHIYSSKLDQAASSQGSYLAFAANLSSEQMAALEIQDVSEVFIEDDFVPKNELLQISRMPKTNPSMKRFWIQGVLLATVSTEMYKKISSDASGVIGNTFGFKGNVYNSKGITTRDFVISIYLIDLDQYNKIFSGFSGLSAFPLYRPILTVNKLNIGKLDGFK